jgi:hypothetical protein
MNAVLQAALRGMVAKIVVDTNLNKADAPMVIDDPFGPGSGQPSTADKAMQLVQPAISLYDANGQVFHTIAPAGFPARRQEIESYKTMAIVGGGLAAVLIALGIAKSTLKK